MVTCCLCFNPIFDQPAGCLTKVLVCENRTDDEPHALCWICVLNLKKNSGKKNEWFLSCPICRNDCFFSEDTIADTGKMSVGVCDECKGDMDEFGPRMKSFTNTCISCKVKKCDVLPAHETFVENYEAFGTAPIVSSRSWKMITKVKQKTGKDTVGVFVNQKVGTVTRVSGKTT